LSTTLRASTKGENEDQPQENWLESLKGEAAKVASNDTSSSSGGGEISTESNSDPEERADNVAIPTTGVSISDNMVDSLRDKFLTVLEPIRDVPGTARILTESSGGGDDPARYIVALSPPQSSLVKKYALVDVPPFSDDLVKKIRDFMGPSSSLSTILVTCRDSIHYDESPAVYVTRKSDLMKWNLAFPGVEIVMYRLDIPRDCREVVTQRLDGDGPWALDEGKSWTNSTFVETGRPLTYMEWDEDTAKKVLDGGEIPKEEDITPDDEDLYTPKAIREREAGKRILAVYTPGRTFGSISYIFPETGVCCSGYSIPIEDDRAEETLGMGPGPNLDYRGYITTNTAGIERQVAGARHLVNVCGDRFNAIFPSRGEMVVFGGDINERKRILNDVLDQYEKIGQIYEQLGIIGTF